MKALSLWRPWHLCILGMGKRIENRSHNRYRNHRGWLLLHAAKKWDPACFEFLRERGLDEPIGTIFDVFMLTVPKFTDSGIVGRCRVVGHVEPADEAEPWDRRPTLVMGAGGDWVTYHADRKVRADDEHMDPPCLALYDGTAAQLDLRWWMGGHGLILADVEALLEAIPCRGRQGLWTPPDDVLEQLPEGWR